MNNKKLTILPILFYSGFASASLYIHQPVENNNNTSGDKNNLRIIFDEDENNSNEARKMAKENKNLVVSKKEKIKQDRERKHYSGGKEYHGGKEYSHNNEYVRNEVENTQEKVAYSNDSLKSPHSIKPKSERVYVKMQTGKLSNSMREHLESIGWTLRWKSGSDRKITVPYIIEYKEGDVVEYVTKISDLYNIFLDVHPSNKTVQVSE